jgi:hypothetical protein
MQFTVGLKAGGKSSHCTTDGSDALEAALKVKDEFPDATITYVRPQNKRGDARHPVLGLIAES